ncbi:MAG: molybdopterin-binding protein, partial [bacterium]
AEAEQEADEMEAMTAASIAVLNLYDLLKPVEDDLEIRTVELESKSGGYSDFQDIAIREQWDLTGAVLVASDSTYEGDRDDKSGKILKEQLEDEDITVEDYTVLPDEQEEIRDHLLGLCNGDLDLVATTGGTGPGPRDVTADA